MDKHLRPAPAEERERPVESILRIVKRAVVSHCLHPGDGSGRCACDDIMAEIEAALPAEDRVVTAGIVHENEDFARGFAVAAKTLAQAQRLRAELYEAIRWQNNNAAAAVVRDAELRKALSELAALTHAIEALRGEMEQLHDAMAQQSAMTTSLQVQERAYCDGKGAAARYAAGKLAAILKEWEGQQ
jgi:hypothetical protein